MNERRAVVFHLTADQILEAVKARFPGVPADAAMEGMNVNFHKGTLEVSVLHQSFPEVKACCEASGFGQTPHLWERSRERMTSQLS